jgi:tetratricopeptide (TPR) repeat protein
MFEQGNGDCVKQYEEALQHYRRIRDIPGEAAVHFNLGHAYLSLAQVRDLAVAEASYRRSLALYDPNDTSGRLRCIAQIGMVCLERFREGRAKGEPAETLKRYWVMAEQCCQDALSLSPLAFTDIQSIYGQLANLYLEIGQLELAREHYEKILQICQHTGDRYVAGQTRFNMARMYILLAEREADTASQRNTLDRSMAYARAALSDFQHYEGRCVADETKARQFLGDIERALANLPQ